MVYVGVGSAVLLLLFGVIWLVISQLRNKYASSIHVIWYLFSLTIFVTLIGFEWARRAGAIDPTGKPGNDLGKTLMSVFDFSLDLQTDFYVLSALVALIVGPQLLSYLLSGFFGCASRPRLVSRCVEFFSWGMAKSSAIASGALLTVSLFGLKHGWNGFDVKFSVKYTCFAITLLVFAFAALLGKATLDEIPILANSRRLEPLRRWLRALDKKMVRHRDG